MKIALYSGSFDPITNGHVDIIKRASKIFDKVIVGVSVNIQKHEFIDKNTRVNLIKESLKDFQNVEVAEYEGLTVDFALKNNVTALVRGIRDTKDFEYELNMAQINSKIGNKIETIFLPANVEFGFISSSAVREIHKFGGNISDFVPDCVKEYLSNK